jgi:hypothetical protein
MFSSLQVKIHMLCGVLCQTACRPEDEVHTCGDLTSKGVKLVWKRRQEERCKQRRVGMAWQLECMRT